MDVSVIDGGNPFSNVYQITTMCISVPYNFVSYTSIKLKFGKKPHTNQNKRKRGSVITGLYS